MKADHRDQLIAAATRLIARDGAPAPTVREIATEAGVATGLLYNHFGDKEELLALALHAHVRAVEAALGPPPEHTEPIDRALPAFVDRAITMHRGFLPAFSKLLNQPEVLTRFRAMTNPTAGGRGLRDQLADYLRAQRAAGALSPTADVDTTATMIIGACHEIVLPHLYGGDTPPTPDTFATALASTVLDGLRPR